MTGGAAGDRTAGLGFVLGALFIAIQAAVTIRAAERGWRFVSTPALQVRVQAVRGRLPPGATLFYFDAEWREAWWSRYWFWELYPTAVVRVPNAEPVEAFLERAAAPGRRTFLLCRGPAPRGIRFRWTIVLPAIPEDRRACTLGEL